MIQGIVEHFPDLHLLYLFFVSDSEILKRKKDDEFSTKVGIYDVK